MVAPRLSAFGRSTIIYSTGRQVFSTVQAMELLRHFKIVDLQNPFLLSKGAPFLTTDSPEQFEF